MFINSRFSDRITVLSDFAASKEITKPMYKPNDERKTFVSNSRLQIARYDLPRELVFGLPGN